MSTILEMAEFVRASESAPATKPVGRVSDVFTKDRINDLCDLFDTTPWGLCCAIESVGSDPRAIGRFLRDRNDTRHPLAATTD